MHAFTNTTKSVMVKYRGRRPLTTCVKSNTMARYLCAYLAGKKTLMPSMFGCASVSKKNSDSSNTCTFSHRAGENRPGGFIISKDKLALSSDKPQGACLDERDLFAEYHH